MGSRGWHSTNKGILWWHLPQQQLEQCRNNKNWSGYNPNPCCSIRCCLEQNWSSFRWAAFPSHAVCELIEDTNSKTKHLSSTSYLGHRPSAIGRGLIEFTSLGTTKRRS